MKFPIFKTKVKGVNKKFNLSDPKDRQQYFIAKCGLEIKKLKDYLKYNTFIVYLLGKKNSGKGTYSKLLGEVFGTDKIEHFSIGDMIRSIDSELKDAKKKKELIDFLEKNYRGFTPFAEIIRALESRSTKTLLPTELILTLVKREIAKKKKKVLFIDGFPRGMDQISYSLFFRDLIGYRDDPDIIVLIDVPEAVIDERIKWRRICPCCQTSRNLKLLPTSKVGHDEKKKEFYLVCDNGNCKGGRMVAKEGDEKGVAPIKDRLKLDGELIEKAFSLHGVPKILLRNSIPVAEAKKCVDDYELTPEFCYEWDAKHKKARIIEKPWIILDDDKVKSYSLMAPPVAVALIKQLVKALDL